MNKPVRANANERVNAAVVNTVVGARIGAKPREYIQKSIIEDV